MPADYNSRSAGNLISDASTIRSQLREVIKVDQKIVLELSHASLQGIVDTVEDLGVTLELEEDLPDAAIRKIRAVQGKVWRDRFTYTFETRILQAKGGFLVTLAYPRELKLLGRRRFYRWVAWGSQSVFWTDTRESHPEPKPGVVSKGESPRGYQAVDLMDLSAGGASISSTIPIYEDRIKVIVPLDKGEINTVATIVRIQRKGLKYEHSLSFDELREADKDRIIAFIFRKQAALREGKRLVSDHTHDELEQAQLSGDSAVVHFLESEIPHFLLKKLQF